MHLAKIIPWFAAGLIVLKWAAELLLEHLNRRHVLAHANAVPTAFKDTMDEPTYAKSVQYALARSGFGRFEDTFDALVLLLVLFSGVLPWALDFSRAHLGSSAWAMAGFLFAAGFILTLPGLPLNWFEQFRLEARFGFNTTTQKTWWLDRLKGFLLALALGYPLLVLVLKFVEWTGDWWWLWAWGALLAFQLVIMVLAPVLILPLFNKFTPLPAGTLRDRLLGLAGRTGFRARAVFVMDGSKRSRHSNAFFTGLGRFRRIVLFDTLVQQLAESELEAVLAHEIGHFKLKHVLKMLGLSALSALVGFYLVAWLAGQAWFGQGFGFRTPTVASTLLLAGLLGGTVSFWLSPVLNHWSRRHEFEADRFAAGAIGGPGPLIGALRKLNRENLSNPAPHPLYSAFYYSHPTLPEREEALKTLGAKPPAG